MAETRAEAKAVESTPARRRMESSHMEAAGRESGGREAVFLEAAGRESAGSVTKVLNLLKAGDQTRAPHLIFRRYFEGLLRIARQVLAHSPQTTANAEDAVMIAMFRFFRAVHRRQFPELYDRRNLWAILVRITIRTAINQRRAASAQRRSQNVKCPVRLRSAIPAANTALTSCVDPYPRPDLILSAAEQCDLLMKSLPQSLAEVARLKLMNYTHREISEQLNLSERTIERRVDSIRRCWIRTIRSRR